MADVTHAMHRVPTPFAACLAGALLAIAGPPAGAEGYSWGYRVGETRDAQQGNFCRQRVDALDVAEIFRRYGAPTGFSALSNAPGCALTVHDATPLALIDAVRVEMEGGGHYTVRFIEVRVDDGDPAVLVTTRELLQE